MCVCVCVCVCDWVGWMVHVCVRIMGMNREGRAGVCGGRGEGEGCFLLCDVLWCACIWCVCVVGVYVCGVVCMYMCIRVFSRSRAQDGSIRG